MSALPKGWVEVTLEDICEFNPKHDPETDRSLKVSFVPMPAVDDETGTIVDKSNVRPLSDIWKGYTHFADHDVIFAKITPCMENGKIAVARDLVNGMACGSTEFHVLRAKGAVQPDFVWRFLRRQSYRQTAERSMTGAVGQRRVPRHFLETTALPLPPLAEQKRIVAKLDALNAKSARARTELARIETLVSRYKQAVLSKAFIHCKGRPVRLVELVEADAPIRYGVLQPGTIRDVGVPLVRVCDLVGGRVVWGQLRRIESSIDQQFSNARIQNGDILLSVVGTIGRIALVEGMNGPANIARAVARIRPKRSIVDPDWLTLRLQARDCQEGFSGAAREVARKTLNVSMIRAIKLALPTLEEQHEIVRRIEATFARIDRLAAQAKRALELVDKLDEAILAKAFRGELVPQDENDEPAERLLARIRAERAAAPKVKRGRGAKA